jgi:chromosome segregation ATPase
VGVLGLQAELLRAQTDGKQTAERLEADEAKASLAILALERQCEALRVATTASEERLVSVTKRLDESLSENARLRSEDTTAHERVAAQEEQLASLQRELAEAHARSAELSRTVDSARTSAEDEVVRVKHALDAAQLERCEATAARAAAEERCATLQADVQRLESAVAALSADAQEAATERATLIGKAEERAAQLAALEQDSSSASAQISSLETALQMQKAECERLLLEVTSLRADSTTAHSTASAAQKEAESASSEVDDLKQKLLDKMGLVKQLRMEADGMKEELQALKSEVDQRDKKVNELKLLLKKQVDQHKQYKQKVERDSVRNDVGNKLTTRTWTAIKSVHDREAAQSWALVLFAPTDSVPAEREWVGFEEIRTSVGQDAVERLPPIDEDRMQQADQKAQAAIRRARAEHEQEVSRYKDRQEQLEQELQQSQVQLSSLKQRAAAQIKSKRLTSDESEAELEAERLRSELMRLREENADLASKAFLQARKELSQQGERELSSLQLERASLQKRAQELTNELDAKCAEHSEHVRMLTEQNRAQLFACEQRYDEVCRKLKEVQETHGAELASHKQKARKLLEEKDAQISKLRATKTALGGPVSSSGGAGLQCLGTVAWHEVFV